MRPIPCLIAAALLCLPALPASADVITRDVEVCYGKKVGDACNAAPNGACKKAECCRNRYLGNQRGPADPRPRVLGDDAPEDTGPRFERVCSPCTRCVANARKKAPKPVVEAPDAAPDLAPDLAPDPVEITAQDAAPDLAPADSAPDLAAPDMAPAAPDLAASPQITAEEPAPQIARKTSGGMCASAPWESQTGAGSLMVGALLMLGLMRARRPR